MHTLLTKYIPEASIPAVVHLLESFRVKLKIVNVRVTRHGDYRILPSGQHQITINFTQNKYRFFVTLIHEIAHLVAFEKYGRKILPHGSEWKKTFQQLMLPFLNPQVFPNELLPVLAQHFKNPKASSDTDIKLALALKQYDIPNGKSLIFELQEGDLFQIHNGRVFQKGPKRIKRFECIEISTGKRYLFNHNAEVDPLKNQ